MVPRGISVLPSGEIYIADTFNHRIRKVALDGTMSTVAGMSRRGLSGDWGPPEEARLSFPFGVFASGSEEVYVVDTNNHRIRKIFALAVTDSADVERLAKETSPPVRAKRVALGSGSVRGVGLDPEGWLVRGLFGPDSQVGLDDFFLFADHYGRTEKEAGFDPVFDLDGSGAVDMEDFFLFADNFGRVVVNLAPGE